MPRFSVIVSTCDRAATLADCLMSLRRQSYPAFEVIVVAGPSGDDTDAVLAAHARRCKLLRCADRNLSLSRNLGLAVAAGEVCAFIDDDAVAHPRWLEQLSRRYLDDRVGGVGGFTVDATGTAYQCRYTVCDRFGNATLFDHIDPASRLAAAGLWLFPSLLGTNSSFRTALLRRIGGFDERFEYMLDETDVCLRLADLGCAIVTAPEAVVFHRYAASHSRDGRRIARTMLAPSRSKAHFVFKHTRARLPLAELSAELDRFRTDLQFSNRWHVDRAMIESRHFLRLNNDVEAGLRQGIESGARAGGEAGIPKPGTSKPSTPKVGTTARIAIAPAPFRRFCEDPPHGQSSRWSAGPPPGSPPGPPWGPPLGPLLGLPGKAPSGRVGGGLRIALVSQGYPPGDTSGIARWTHELARALTARGHEIHVITAAATARHIGYHRGVWVHAVPPARGACEPGPVDLPASIHARAAAVLTEARLIQRDFGLDVLSAPIWDVEGILCAARLDIPVVTSLHTAYRVVLPLKEQWRGDLAFRLHHVEKVIAAETWLLRNAALLLANSGEIRTELAALYGVALPPGRVAVVPHGIAPAPDRPAPDRPAPEAHRWPEEGQRVLYVGRIERRKGLDLLLEAITPLFDVHPDLQLDIVGAAVPEETAYALLIDSLSAALAQRGHDTRVTWHGYVADAVLEGHYAACDVFVAPSRFESFGLIAIEAMRFGKPVIAARVGGLAEIVEPGLSGELFAAESVESLRAALDALLCDATARARMGRQAAVVFAERFTSAVMARNVERCLHDLLGTGAALDVDPPAASGPAPGHASEPASEAMPGAAIAAAA